MCVKGFPSPPKNNSWTPAGYAEIQLNSDIIYLETVSETQEKPDGRDA